MLMHIICGLRLGLSLLGEGSGEDKSLVEVASASELGLQISILGSSLNSIVF
jgi:hypothetical protein